MEPTTTTWPMRTMICTGIGSVHVLVTSSPGSLLPPERMHKKQQGAWYLKSHAQARAGIALVRSGQGLGADATVKVLTVKIQKRPIRENFNPRKFPAIRYVTILLFCRNIPLWIVLEGAAKLCAALWVLKMNYQGVRNDKKIKKQDETQILILFLITWYISVKCQGIQEQY